jgi:hypothetical protein
MNSHLNIFKSYTKENRDYQLENDLTRAFAICLQEDNLFFHEILKFLFNGSEHYNQLFEDLEGNAKISIEIQRSVKTLGDFDHLYAVSLSENKMVEQDFWSNGNHKNYDPICDVVIRINNILILFEAKRNNIDCTSQLYNQCYNLCTFNEIPIGGFKDCLTPIDLNWPFLMEMAVKLLSFEKATNTSNRFLSDFIDLIRIHNFKWLPEPAIASLRPDNSPSIIRRIQSAVTEFSKLMGYILLENRIGVQFGKPWAQEILFSVSNEGNLIATIYPGNTKAQGTHLFKKDPSFYDTVCILGTDYDLENNYHIKFTSFQRYFSGLFFGETALLKPLYTKANFSNYSGRKKRGVDWQKIETLFDHHFDVGFNWREKCNWDTKVLNSGKNQFDISFGYEISVIVPFKTLQTLDSKKSDLSNLVNLMNDIYQEFDNNLLK